jgi:hypothetical protein
MSVTNECAHLSVFLKEREMAVTNATRKILAKS